MPAITLRSTQITLRSCCDHRTDHPAIRLRSSAITLCSIPPYPRADRSPALGRWARRSGDPKKGREARGGKAPRYRHACRNAEVRADRRCIMRSIDYGPNALVTVTLGYSSLPGRFPQSRHTLLPDRKRLIALAPQRCRPLCPNHVASVGKGFSRALSHELQHSWKLTRARKPADPVPDSHGLARRNPGSRGVGGNPARYPIFTCPFFFAPVSQKFGRHLPQTSLSIV